MSRSLFDRLSTWARLFQKRPDVEVIQALQLETPDSEDESEDEELDEDEDEDEDESEDDEHDDDFDLESDGDEDSDDDFDEDDEEGLTYPPDAAEFAKKCIDFSFHFVIKGTELHSMLALSLRREYADAELDTDGLEKRVAKLLGKKKVAIDSEARGFELDQDRAGRGLTGYLLYTDDGSPFVMWDLETSCLFSSVTDYLTEGAKHAFMMSDKSWPQCRPGRNKERAVDSARALRKCSLAATTPPEEVKAALRKQGATEEEADDLWEWLAQDCVLLIAASS
jgi:hypothetical protein